MKSIKNNMTTYQEESLRSLFQYLSNNNQYYSKLFRKYSLDLQGKMQDELHKLPIIEKYDIRNNDYTYFSSTDEKVFLEYTSGSVGIPLKCYKTASERALAAVMQWKLRKEIDPLVSPQNYYHVFGSKNSEWADYSDLNEKNMIRFIENINHSNLRWLSSPISTIYEMARVMHKGLVSNECIKYIELVGEYSDPERRHFIEEAFGSKTIVHYGTKETWCIAYECECKHLHIQDKLFYLETSGEDLDFGDGNGKIILTSIYQKYMPFIRYNLGDIGRIQYERCECGRATPRLELAGGRVADIIKGRKLLGNILFSRVVDEVLRAGYDCIKRFKVIQTELNAFEIHIVKTQEYTNAVSELLIAKVKNRLSQDTEVRIVFVDDMKLTASGKHKIFECLI